MMAVKVVAAGFVFVKSLIPDSLVETLCGAWLPDEEGSKAAIRLS